MDNFFIFVLRTWLLIDEKEESTDCSERRVHSQVAQGLMLC
jgi:hypothetical protein